MNILKSGLLIFLFLNASNSFSQDLFIYKDGSELNVKVLRVNKNDISYKKNSNINGPEYVEDKINLFMIKYENGTKDIFINNSEEKNINENSKEKVMDIQESNCKHQVDSIVFMNNKYMIVCKSCNKKIRYATTQEVKSNITNNSDGISNNVKIPCGSEPEEPPRFNNPQYKQTQAYKKYKKDHREWRDCSGN
jgi:hypothetical protein